MDENNLTKITPPEEEKKENEEHSSFSEEAAKITFRMNPNTEESISEIAEEKPTEPAESIPEITEEKIEQIDSQLAEKNEETELSEEDRIFQPIPETIKEFAKISINVKTPENTSKPLEKKTDNAPVQPVQPVQQFPQSQPVQSYQQYTSQMPAAPQNQPAPTAFSETNMSKSQPLSPYGQQPQQFSQPMSPYGQQPQQYNRPPQPYGQPQQFSQPMPPYGQQPQQYNRPPQPYGQPQQFSQPMSPYGQQPQQYNRPPQPYGQPQQFGQPSPVIPPVQMMSPEAVQKKKKLSKGWLIGILSFICVMIAAIIIMLIAGSKSQNTSSDNLSDNQSYSDSGDKTTDKDKDKEAEKDTDGDVIVNIPVQDRPKLEDELYVDKESGLFTTVGVSQYVSPCVVGIQAYGDTKLYPVSSGSGIILSDQGYIITNAHVIEGTKSYKVILSDSKEYVAELVGKDYKTDLAVLKIDAQNLTAADFGNSDQISIGEQVAVIGNPGDFSNTVSFGYVSGLNREVTAIENGYKMKCIQTDAAVNPGNSGGPLVNMYGQVIGIVSAKYVATDYEGIGFAISINEALPIVKDIISKGYISDRVKIGILYVAIDADSAKQLNAVPGLLVREIDPDCDVANTEIEVDDIITEINGMEVSDGDSIRKALSGLKPGDKITLKVYRVNIAGEASEFEAECKLEQDTSLS